MQDALLRAYPRWNDLARRGTAEAYVVLRFSEDLSFAQISLVLGCTESTARSHVHRAIGALRTRLTEGADHD